MEILDMYVNWNVDVGNDPHLEVLVDKIPTTDKFRFEMKNNLYFSEHEGYCRFFYQSTNKNGYGGSKFKLHMKTGDVVTLDGPWSSRSGCCNKLGFVPCTRVSITSDPQSFINGHFTTGHMTVAKLNEALPHFLPQIHLRRVIKFDGEPYYLPCPIGVAFEDAKKVGIGMFEARNSKFREQRSDAYRVDVVHISQPLKEWQDGIAKAAFGMTKAECQEATICISCKMPVINRIQSDAGWREYGISGLCEICFDSITGGE